MSELTQRHLPKLIGLILTLAIPAAGVAQAAPQTALFTEDFNSKVRLIGKNSQAQTLLRVKHAHDLPGWTKQGADMPAHWVEQYPGNWVFMLVANKAGQNVFTQNKGIAANDKGHTYTVSFDAGPAVYAALSQATVARDEIAVELLRADGTVLKKHVVAPGKWQGKLVLKNHTFAYQGDGSGPLRFRISPVYKSGLRFFGAIEHLQVFGSADEATAAIAGRRKMDKEKREATAKSLRGGPHKSHTPRFTFAETLKEQEKQLKTNELMLRFAASRKKHASTPYRPAYHFVSPENMLNDPNGLCFWQGRWHLFYQGYPPDEFPNPRDIKRRRQHWGHAVSDDLVHWRDLPYAIYPGIEKMCFSGSTVVEEKRVVAFYPGIAAGQMVAVADDPLLLNWDKHGPVNTAIGDSCIWKESDTYFGLTGNRLWASKDLVHWEARGEFVEKRPPTAAREDQSCPNFQPIGDKHILLFFSHTNGGQYFLGDYDKKNHRFKPYDHGRFNHGKVAPGGVHAPSATSDGKGGVINILNINGGRQTDDWDQIMSLPQHLTLDKHKRLHIQPIKAIESLRGKHRQVGKTVLAANKEIVLEAIKGNTMELDVEIDPKNSRWVRLNVLRSTNAEEQTSITFYNHDRKLTYWYHTPSEIVLDGSRSTTLPDVDIRPPERAILGKGSQPLKLRIFIDRSVVEVFANGKQYLAMRVYPGRKDSVGVSLRAQGQDAVLNRLDAWQMKAIWPKKISPGPKKLTAMDTPPWRLAIQALWESEYGQIERGLRANRQVKPGRNPYVFDEQSLLLTTDKTPLDVQLRRTRALLAHLKKIPVKKIPGTPDPRTFAKTVNDIAAQVQHVRKSGHAAQIKNLYMKLRAVTRQAALSNPLLAFNDLLFMGYMKPRGHYHMVDQYSGWTARPGGGIYILRSFKSNPSIVNVLAKSVVTNGRFKRKSLVGGAFLRPDLSFNAQRITFAWNNIKDKCYHIFTVNVDGSKLTMLTDGTVNFNGRGLMNSSQNDFDPIWLPNGRIAFLSERRGGYLRCSAKRPLMTFVLHSMKDDGSDLIPISYHETNEWNPSVDRDGKIVYTRWDYVDRDDCIAHHIWTCYPDGRDPRAPHGNYPLPLSYKDRKKPDGRRFRPNGEWNIRAIPNSNKYIATASGHHTHSFGELIMIDTSIPDDGMMSQVKGITTGRRIWPDGDGDYAAAWPLSEDYYLCTYRKNIILLDRFGNKEIICPARAMPTKVDRVMHPIPLEPRPVPPVIPTGTYQGQRANVDAPAATISVMNVYEADMPMPEGTRIKWLRVIQIIPQLNPVMNKPQMGYGSESLARMPLGIVPVETDGSVYFKAPVAKNLYFQLLDKRGLAVRSMRSATYVHPGESMSCVGCHESRESAPKSRAGPPMALRRAPSDLKPEVPDGAVPYNWYRLAKPVLDAKCVSCHTKKNKPPNMTYASLRKYAFYYPFRTTGYTNGEIVASGSRTVPGKFGAMASPLLEYLDKSHYDVSLTPKEFRRITLWLDCNANELGAYTKAAQQRRGQIVWPEIDVDPKNPLGLQKVARGR